MNLATGRLTSVGDAVVRSAGSESREDKKDCRRGAGDKAGGSGGGEKKRQWHEVVVSWNGGQIHSLLRPGR
jgi:hypothetical protein